jgi:hypothetical protein
VFRARNGAGFRAAYREDIAAIRARWPEMLIEA